MLEHQASDGPHVPLYSSFFGAATAGLVGVLPLDEKLIELSSTIVASGCAIVAVSALFSVAHHAPLAIAGDPEKCALHPAFNTLDLDSKKEVSVPCWVSGVSALAALLLAGTLAFAGVKVASKVVRRRRLGGRGIASRTLLDLTWRWGGAAAAAIGASGIVEVPVP